MSNTLPALDAQRRNVKDDPADALGRGGRSVARNVQQAGFTPIVFTNGVFTRRVTALTAGQTAQIFIPADGSTSRLIVELSDITSDLPAAQHNPVVGERALVHLIDAPTAWAPEWEFAWERVSVDTTVWSRTIEAPQTGLLRLAVQGDQRNAGRLSATITIRREQTPKTIASATGKVKQDDFLSFDFDVPAGTNRLTFATSWGQNWSRYPTNDIDMYLVDPADNVLFDGVTWSSPERVSLNRPAAGRWTVVVAGFTVHRGDGQPEDPNKLVGRVDDFELDVTADGRRLKRLR